MSEAALPKKLWGIHMPAEVGDQPIDESYVGIGWGRMGELSAIGPTRDAFKAHYRACFPEEPESKVPVSAGVPYRFTHEMREGDGVIYPSKSDRRVNLGILTGPLRHVQNAPVEQTTNRRAVRWIAHLPRESFSQSALYEIGSAVTLFQVANYPEEFLTVFSGQSLAPSPIDVRDAEAASVQIDETTDDFVLRCLKSSITPEQFEHFVADLLRAMGYRARVTKRTGDGGIDIIAHRDELGFEPPIIKVQCKQIINAISRPDIQRLDGAIQHGEFGLFVTLGTYSADARTYEQMKPNLRLVDGGELSALIQQHYDGLASAAKAVVPLRRTFVPGNR